MMKTCHFFWDSLQLHLTLLMEPETQLSGGLNQLFIMKSLSKKRKWIGRFKKSGIKPRYLSTKNLMIGSPYYDWPKNKKTKYILKRRRKSIVKPCLSIHWWESDPKSALLHFKTEWQLTSFSFLQFWESTESWHRLEVFQRSLNTLLRS